MGEWSIDAIRALTEEQTIRMASHIVSVKEHDVYFVDFGGYFKRSALVFYNGAHIYYANEYELHHHLYNDKSDDEIYRMYETELNKKLFTDEELTQIPTDYTETERKKYFLNNYYGMRKPYISIWFAGDEKERQRRQKQIKTMLYDGVAFAYYDQSERAFIDKHYKLYKAVCDGEKALKDSLKYWTDAILYQMCNVEYAINWQADWDLFSHFGNVAALECEDPLEKYFEACEFSETQQKAYYAAKKEYYAKHANY